MIEPRTRTITITEAEHNGHHANSALSHCIAELEGDKERIREERILRRRSLSESVREARRTGRGRSAFFHCEIADNHSVRAFNLPEADADEDDDPDWW